MEGHISNKYAKFITSRPHAYSENGLENITQLLTMKANNVKLTEEIYYKFKTEKWKIFRFNMLFSAAVTSAVPIWHRTIIAVFCLEALKDFNRYSKFIPRTYGFLEKEKKGC